MHFANGSQFERNAQYRAVKRHGNETWVGIHIGEQVGDSGNAATTMCDYLACLRQRDDGKEEDAHRIVHSKAGVSTEARVAFKIPDESVCIHTVSTHYSLLTLRATQH